jgi:pseudouridine synthase
LAHRLTHPRFEVRRAYLAEVRGAMSAGAIKTLMTGVRLEDGLAKAVDARIIRRGKARTQVELVLTEGRKREVRRLLEAVGFPVISLVRTRFGPVDVKGLKAGSTRPLTPQEVGELHKLVGL